ncbi:MAG: hypothetical protein HN472_00865 [Nitrospina sp.]|nr:hypothetical protein [Nitrospina sp.]MBT3508077.1 hypothetical protein [Nitrospina sp.]MBT3876670.1 hypothetical protein [Nitrospina sp.]MBT4049623.1 hypothetical protein [Nitrospina sp.]MBT4558335.1 hypothetical protein [Nitrospina sp.]
MIRLQSIFHSIKKFTLGYGSGLVLLGALGAIAPSTAFALYIQIDGVADIKTNFSEGCSSIKDLASQAERQKIDVVLFGDLARNSMEFGIKPFERIFKNITQGPSVLDRGASGFIAEIKENDRQFERTLLIPGVETIPFYFWSGSNYDKNLTAHNWDKHLLVFGMDSTEDFEQLPLPNSNFSKKYTHELLNNFIIIGFIFMVTVGAVYKGYFRKFTVPLMLFFALMTLNNHPFQSSPFDPYHGDQGMEPYQNLIDFATSKGALVFWNHMEIDSGIGQKGTTMLETLPYPDDLLKTQNYTGFQAVGDNPIRQTEPGQQWDQVLMEYLNGNREHPVWGFGGNDYLCENQKGDQLGSVRTIFLVRERNNDTVLEAMKNGRMYAVRQSDANRLSLDEFVVEDQKTGSQVTMGQELVATDFPAIKLKLRTIQGGNKTAQIQIIRNGALVKEETVSLPYELTWRDVGVDRKESVYYRVKAQVSPQDHLVSNPIFVKFSDTTGMDIASAPAPEPSPPKNVMKKPVVPPTRSVSQPEAPQVESLSGALSPTPPALSEPTLSEPIQTPAPVPQPVMKEPSMAEPAQPTPPFAELPPGRRLTIMTDGVALKKGPGTVFPNITKLRKGEEVSFVRRTNIEFNKRNWLVVKYRNRSGYLWEGVVKWSEAQQDADLLAEETIQQ